MIEALWSILFGTTEQRYGAGVIVFETNRIFGGDTCFYYVGNFSVKDGMVTGEVEVIRHAPGMPFIFESHDGGRIRLTGQVSAPQMVLTGHLAQDSSKTIAVVCNRLADLP